MGQIEGELESLLNCLLRPESVNSAELLTEELARRVVDIGRRIPYQWDSDTISARISMPDGLDLVLTGKEGERSVIAELEWASTGNRKYEHVKKYLPTRTDQAISVLKGKGWVIMNKAVQISQARFTARINVNQLSTDIHRHAEALAQIVRIYENI
jgi:hypothetical protein